ncbi:tRNA pseudouridine synthase B [Catonella morbi ATCC 51271]|uniref:tRNA pseudouridine synthase B n=1 Tax=Catonella morbi ATCC 51271 TaxID=592026 RepID=V2XRD0_9FIRM|nr:tRNA pseudouridine(55) synthase TruB [Catonella morbi]ESL04734.1 tRNA pseudouridine synthase B [Catonella morbi ATCC 51271]
MINGVINVYKEVGYTSRDAVSRLTGILRQRKIGHTGTLDPAAEGVLPMCVGKATKLCELLTGHKKQYIAVMKLGIATDTEDTTGEITEKTNYPENWYEENLTAENLTKITDKFIGTQFQTPPMYSAKRVNGRRLYELAREGKVIERKPCEITVYGIEIKNIDIINREITVIVDCSKGTYIRTLCKDIGEALGCKAAMKSLLRTRTGDFYLENSYKLDEIEKIVKENRVDEIIIPIEKIFYNLRRIDVTGYAGVLLDNGGIVNMEEARLEPGFDNIKDGEKFRMYNKDGEFKAVYCYYEKINALKIDKMF